MNEDHQKYLTDSQRQALHTAWEILKEHFDHALLVYDTEISEGTDRAIETFYHGGMTTALGLADIAKNRLLTTRDTP